MALEFRLPDIGEGLTEAEIVEWLADVGDRVVADHPLVVVETDKTQAELPAPISGVLLHRGADEGSVLAVGEILAVVGEPGETWGSADEGPASGAASPRTSSSVGAVGETEVPPQAGEPAGAIMALPLVRRAARDAGVDLADVAGTGPGGRITRADLAAHIEGRTETAERPPLVGTLVESAEDLGRSSPGTETVRLSPTRRAISERLTAAWREIPHVTTFDSFDATELLDRRRSLSAGGDRSLPVEALVIAAVVPVLQRHREFNATLHGDQLTLHGRIDVGFAVDAGDGLLVAVVRDVVGRPIDDLGRIVRDLSERAKNRTLNRADMTGATFTVSNIGAVGGGYGTPIIPLGTTAILSIGRASDTVIARNGGITIAPVAPLSLSYDHRVIDGAAGRAFMADVVAALEHPRPA
jgi:pyruvate/2-oxoglutarate dehydrogenase complex dihydrolipoamide acyltransferase (E2) component